MWIKAIPLEVPEPDGDPRTLVRMNADSHLLGVGVEQVPVVRVLVIERGARIRPRRLVVLRNGQYFPVEENIGVYLGTVFTENSPPALHVFDQGWGSE